MNETANMLKEPEALAAQKRERSGRIQVLLRRISILSEAGERIEKREDHCDPDMVMEALCDVIREASQEAMGLLERRWDEEQFRREMERSAIRT